MNKIKKTIITVVGVILFCFIISLFIPELKDSFLLIWSSIWIVLKKFFLDDIVKSVILYIVIAAMITAAGFVISYKTEKKIWSVISVIIDIAGLVALIGKTR